MYSVVKMDLDKCTRCGICIFACPEPNVFKFNKAFKEISIEENRCKGCGLCVSVCPKEALTVKM